MNCNSYYGREYDVFNFTPEMVSLLDIAHSLAIEPRFGGHTHEPYSVAQHGIFVMEIVQRATKSPTLTLAALHHDDSEAYLKDLPRAIKHHPSMAYYREVEGKVQNAIHAFFKLPEDCHHWPSVKQADDSALFHEIRSLTNRARDCLMPYIRIKPWGWKEARDNFIRAHNTLMSGGKWDDVLIPDLSI